MSRIENELARYSALGISHQSCIAGSFAIAVLNEIARERNYTPLVPEGRIFGDVDIFTGKLNTAFSQVVHNANLAASPVCESGDCVTFDLDGEHYDVSCDWPFLVATTGKIEDVSVDVGGIRVMDLGLIANSKRRLGRDKDLGDLRQIEIALGFRRH